MKSDRNAVKPASELTVENEFEPEEEELVELESERELNVVEFKQLKLEVESGGGGP
jgi:hypothetical protein